MKKIIEKTIDINELNGELITTWISKLLDLQKQHGVCATISAKGDDDGYGGCNIDFIFNYLETGEEYKHRIEREAYLKQRQIEEDIKMKIESYLYGKYIDELAGTLEEVLDASRVGESVEEAKDLYEKAMVILPKHREEMRGNEMNMYEDGILLWVGWVVMALVLAGIVGYVDVKENDKANCQYEETK